MSVMPLETTESLRGPIMLQGGDYHVLPPTATYPSASSTYMSGVRYPANYIPFVVSLYNVETNTARFPLNLLVNPADIQYGQSKSMQNNYTRKGWVSTYWGGQQRTLTVSGSSAAFYYNPKQVAETVEGLKINVAGLSNYYRRNSVAFANLLTLISLYKNNGAYFLKSPADQTYWKDGTSRVIHVMDFVMISYDGEDYLGSFNTFTIEDSASMPYRIQYNFEFVVSGILGADSFDGHLRKANNADDPKVEVSIQGDDMEFAKMVEMDVDELNRDFGYKDTGSTLPPEMVFPADNSEVKEESEYWKNPENNKPMPNVPLYTVRVARGMKDGESHDKKADYIPSSGEIRALHGGKVVAKQAHDGYGGYNYVIVKTKVLHNGEWVDGYIRYWHVDTASLRAASYNVGDEIPAGTLIGRVGTDGGKYPPHCDLEVQIAKKPDTGYDWTFANRIDCTDTFDAGVKNLSKMSRYPDGTCQVDYTFVQYKHGPKNSPVSVPINP